MDGIDNSGETLIDKGHEKQFPHLHFLRDSDNGNGCGVEDCIELDHQFFSIVHDSSIVLSSGKNNLPRALCHESFNALFHLEEDGPEV